MIIKEMKLPIKDLIGGYFEDEKSGRVTGWNGRLDIRPPYQREFVYGEKQRDAVIQTVLSNFPLNIMYFVDHQDGSFEVLDGQQRIISICRFAQNQFSVKLPTKMGDFDFLNFPNLYSEQRNTFLNYKLTVYLCEGTDDEKLSWFQIINIAGAVLEQQEIRNALYHGSFLTDAKSVFSRRNCAAHKLYGKYMAGDYIRQKYLETAIAWKADQEEIIGKDPVSDYMKAHRFDKDADDLWNYFEKVFMWEQKIFGKNFDKSQKGVAWGLLYNKHKDDNLDPKYCQKQMKELLADSEVQKKSGIYEYILTGEEKCLNLRRFDDSDILTMYHKQNGRCAICGAQKELKEMHADHIKPWSQGGRTTLENGQMLCTICNLKKSNN